MTKVIFYTCPSSLLLIQAERRSYGEIKCTHMSTILNLTLAELAICEPYSIAIFEKYHLDYYLNGTRTLHEACMEKGVDDLIMDGEFSLHKEAFAIDSAVTKYDELDIERLIECIETKYHSKETVTLPLLFEQIKLLKEEHGHLYPRMGELEIIFGEMMDALKHHAFREEKVLFPYVKKMADMRKNKTKSLTQISLITNPLRLLEFEHAHTNSEIDTIRQITDNYFIPDDVSKEYKWLMEELYDFEKSFHQHIHLENNILFPKIIELELELLESIRHNLQ